MKPVEDHSTRSHDNGAVSTMPGARHGRLGVKFLQPPLLDFLHCKENVRPPPAQALAVCTTLKYQIAGYGRKAKPDRIRVEGGAK
jgi:hypothetical protein